jgi:exosome complex exonuclease RRP6
MDHSQDFKTLQDQIQAALIATTRTTGQIASEDLGFQRSFNTEVGTALDEQSERLLALASALVKSAVSISELRAPALADADDVENNWRSVVDVVDSLLEKSDTCLDEYTGVIKRKEPENGGQPGQVMPKFSSISLPEAYISKSSSKSKKQGPLGNAFRTQNLVKPQLAFENKPNNDDNSSWKPLLTTKPHAAVPLEESLGMVVTDSEQQQYEHTPFLPLLTLPPSPATPEGLSKRTDKNTQ